MINQLVANIKKTGAPIVVGLDPMLNYIPEQVQKKAFAEYGETLEGAAEAIWQFNKGIVDAYDLIAVASHSRSENQTADSAETVNADFNSHFLLPPFNNNITILF